MRRCLCCIVVLIVIAAIAIGLGIFVKSKVNNSNDGVNPNYSDALFVAMQFFDVQKSGKLVDNRISWRGDSALKDGNEENLDLSKGLYDAGDHIKFGFPMAFTATVLSWAILEYGDHMASVKLLDPAQENLKWITDYLINAHPKDDVLYIQVGDPEVDHKCWQRPETMTEKRPLTKVDNSTPGTEVAAETAAAMAAASLVFKTSNPTYSTNLLKHAKQLFDFADKYRGSYSESIPEVATYYNSTGYGDELLWAASWLYHATENNTYLDYVNDNGKEFADFGNPSWFSWDNKLAGTQVLLSRVNMFGSKDLSSTVNSGLQSYRETAEAVICGLMPNSPTATSSRTDGGLVWVSEWNALQQPVAAAFLAVMYSDYMLSSETATAEYVLGKNPMKLSYLVGYGDSFPQYVHHRGASIPADADTGCDGFTWLNSNKPNPYVAIGALVGGPFLNETYIDSRNNSMQGEPSTYNSALLVGLLSGLVTTSWFLYLYGVPLPFAPIPRLSVRAPSDGLIVGLSSSSFCACMGVFGDFKFVDVESLGSWSLIAPACLFVFYGSGYRVELWGIRFLIMANITLRSILDTNKLSGNNFDDWYQNLRIVLMHEKLIDVIDKPAMVASLEGESNASALDACAEYSEESTAAKCIILASMSPELQRQYENMILSQIIAHLKKMYESQSQNSNVEENRLINESTLEPEQPENQIVHEPLRRKMVSYTTSTTTQEMKHQYDLNSLQKSSRIIKKPTLAAQQNPPKVYKVQPIHFRELVQKLTGAQPGELPRPQPVARRSALYKVAPPPLPINSHHLQLCNQTQTSLVEKQVSCKVEQALTSSPVDQKIFDKKDGWEGMTELTLSPNFQAWFNFAMSSPGTAPVSY
ncbi:hypothetical protein KSS87_004240 [Heliosperma pusillum]|nr:hypothetical protein KSS87_004240 [Heliosperma pusillum]